MAQPAAVAESSQAALKPSHPLPLANSLQSTLALLLSRLGRLLAYQAQLRKAAQASQSSSSTNLDIRCVPGFSDLTKAAQKWQKEVEALHLWIQRGQDALTIELQKTLKREAVEAEQERVRKAKAEEEEKAREKIKAEELAAKGEEKVDAKEQATGSTADTPVIDLTSDDGPDKRHINSDGKRSRSEQEGDEDASKRAKIDSTSSDAAATAAATVNPTTPDPASLLASLTALQSSSSSAPQSNDQQQPPTSSNNDNFDFANMPEMDFANFDLSFMNDPNFSMPGADTTGSVGFETGQSGNDGSSTGLSFDQMYPDGTGGGVGGTGSNDDASMMGMMGGGADGGMELGAALQGIDWNNFLSGFDGSAGGSTGQ